MPGEIEFKPAQTVTSARRMSVVVVVPALSEGEQSNPPAVAGQVRAVEVAVSEGVGG